MVYTEEQLAEKIAKLPKYTVSEEQANVITHFIGMIIGIIGLLIMFSFAIVRTIRDINNFVDIISSLVFGGSMVALYTMSTVYHNEKNLKKRVFRQKFDHLSINILIAGSCSAFMISGLKNNIGYILISCVWALSILSMVLNWINVKKFRAVTMVIYILTGWAPIIVVNYVIAICGIGCFALVLAGGLCYTIGLTFYAIKKEFMHSIWHIFVLIGSILHIVGACIYVYII